MIEINNLSLSLGTRKVLDGINFTLSNESNLVIIGRSGSGKTVLIKTLLGMYEPDEGRISIDGVDVYTGLQHDRKRVLDGVSMVFQNAALLDSLTVRQNIVLPLYERRNHDASEIERMVEESLDIIGLPQTINLFPAELSGGMRKRIGIARALVYKPQYIIFDEPISGLDPITASEIMYYIAKIGNEKLATTITITHQLRDIDRIADIALFIDDGKVVYSGSLEGLYNVDNELVSRFVSK